MKKKIKWFIILSMILIISVLWIANYCINSNTDNLVFNDLNKIPFNKVGLLLGTSKYLSSGLPNQYFEKRIKAAVNLFKSK